MDKQKLFFLLFCSVSVAKQLPKMDVGYTFAALVLLGLLGKIKVLNIFKVFIYHRYALNCSKDSE